MKNFHSAFTIQCVYFTQSDSLTHPQGWRFQSQVYRICLSSQPWIRLCASRNHRTPANNSSTNKQKIRLSASVSSPPPYIIRFFVSVSLPSHWFSAECSHRSPFCSHRVSPPPTNQHTDISKRSEHIFNSLPTHTSSTIPTLSISPILQELVDSWTPFPITVTH